MSADPLLPQMPQMTLVQILPSLSVLCLGAVTLEVYFFNAQKTLTQTMRHKKYSFFKFPRRGGGLAESKISLTEKTEILLDFFWQKGWKGGVSPIPKGFYHKILIFFHQIPSFFSEFSAKKSGGGLAQSKICLTEKFGHPN